MCRFACDKFRNPEADFGQQLGGQGRVVNLQNLLGNFQTGKLTTQGLQRVNARRA